MKNQSMVMKKLEKKIKELKMQNRRLKTFKCKCNKIIEQKETAKKKWKSLFNNMTNGFSLHEIVLNKNNKPVDYIFLDINREFEKQTGLKRKNVIGRKATEILPGIEKDPADWIGTYGEVALKGKSISFEKHNARGNFWRL